MSTCVVCGREFVPYRGNGMLCSPECRIKHKNSKPRNNTLVEFWCEACGRIGRTTLSAYNRADREGRSLFCSKKCFKESMIIYRKCDFCEKVFQIPPSTFTKHMYCSMDCYRKDDAYVHRQEDHYRWRGGGGTYYRGPGWNTIRKMIRMRDNYTCQICGITEQENGKKLDVHHIVPYRKFASHEDANKPENLTSLCQSCHHSVDAMIRDKDESSY